MFADFQTAVLGADHESTVSPLEPQKIKANHKSVNCGVPVEGCVLLSAISESIFKQAPLSLYKT